MRGEGRQEDLNIQGQPLDLVKVQTQTGWGVVSWYTVHRDPLFYSELCFPPFFPSVTVPSLPPELFFPFETGFFCVALAVLLLTL